jgi:hypothetical protein
VECGRSYNEPVGYPQVPVLLQKVSLALLPTSSCRYVSRAYFIVDLTFLSVLETPNASYFLRVEENNVELSTLNFSFNLCIALGTIPLKLLFFNSSTGAMIAGKKDFSTAFFHRADEQLAVLQKNQANYLRDYSMALALVAMAAQAINLNISTDKVESYLDAMTKICNDQNRCNSDAFVRLLLLLAFHSTPYKEKVSLEELILKQSAQENFPLPSISLDSISLVAINPQATEKRDFSRTFQISMPVSLGSMRDISTGRDS